ncbi:MAG: LON peptidase substrate-binding domain-containing protein [Marinobacterium sp.]
MAEICIFPIPGCVSFPGTVFPLHVFEPRYRDMIKHCLDTGTPVAICHTRKTLSHGKKSESLEEALRSNQTTYRPYDIFSAGCCELLEVLADGRMLLNIHIEQRYRRTYEVQLLPWQVYECERFEDQPMGPDEAANCMLLRDKIIHRLQALTYADPTARELISQVAEAEEWQQKDHSAFSFALFSVIRFDPSLLQSLLEMDSAHGRLQYTLELLNQL